MIPTRRITVGTYAFMFTQKQIEKRRAQKDEATHQWTCMLRDRDCPSNSLENIIKKVVFTLHPSFPQPQRVVEKPPFEIEECGWGEFEISLKLFLIDEKILELKHYLRLYPTDTNDIRLVKPPSVFKENPVINETHDEIIFRQPTDKLKNAFSQKPPLLPKHPLSQFFGNGKFDEEMYVAQCELLSAEVLEDLDVTSFEMREKAKDLQSLMQMYFTLYPEKALRRVSSSHAKQNAEPKQSFEKTMEILSVFDELSNRLPDLAS